MRIARRKATGGFSLLELLVAMSVLLLGILGLLATLINCQRLDSLSREKTQALATATNEMNTLLTSKYDTLLGKHGTTFDVSMETAPGTTINLKPGAGRTKPGRIEVVATPKTDLLRLNITVRWRSSVGNDVDVELTTCVSRH